MELFTHRHRELTVLVLVLVVQLLLLGYQVRGPEDTRLVRVWAVSAVTPAAKLLETTRRGVTSVLDNYVFLVGLRKENLQLRAELNQLKLEAQYLRSELATADRAMTLSAFRARNPSKTVAAHIIGASTVADSRVVYIDRGTSSGVAPGMALITPDGIVGRVRAVFPRSAQATLITDSGFAAGVISQNNRAEGTLKGRGDRLCLVDHIQNEQRVEIGEWFYTSGDDRLFPRGLPVGRVESVTPGQEIQEILVAPAGLEGGLEEVLVVIEAVHQPLPDELAEPQPAQVMLPPPDQAIEGREGQETSAEGVSLQTDADRIMDRYRRVGEAQGHTYGTGLPGSTPPDFNIDPDPTPSSVPAGNDSP